MLPRTFRNDLVEAVQVAGLDRAECTFEGDEAEVRITHVPSASYFVLGGDFGRFTTAWRAGDLPEWKLDRYTWSTVVEGVERWAREVRREVDTPDLWAEVQREREMLTGARYEEVGNTPFTVAEQAEIAEQIRALKEFVKDNYSLSTAKMASVERKLDDIAAAASRMGRKDWGLLVGGVMLSVIVGDLVSPEVVHHMFAMLRDGVDHLFGGGGGPPQMHPTT